MCVNWHAGWLKFSHSIVTDLIEDTARRIDARNVSAARTKSSVPGLDLRQGTGVACNEGNESEMLFWWVEVAPASGRSLAERRRRSASVLRQRGKRGRARDSPFFSCDFLTFVVL